MRTNEICKEQKDFLKNSKDPRLANFFIKFNYYSNKLGIQDYDLRLNENGASSSGIINNQKKNENSTSNEIDEEDPCQNSAVSIPIPTTPIPLFYDSNSSGKSQIKKIEGITGLDDLICLYEEEEVSDPVLRELGVGSVD
ncbi:7515_t:CDS:2 [Funneliformis caledonium]|uniref:7515_t:CDS:1 n=1 Tax=Funneliformis caledonium TaxID=1117310 RepID=A0A9N9C011_9GLOM|nr:7515_t:CDS:2 [Funneliformis caledonium]